VLTAVAVLSLAVLAASPEVKSALQDAEARREQFIEEWIHIAEIPAPSGDEGRRADYLESRFRQLGLEGVTRDHAGNVVGLLRGRDPSLQKVALVAHLDTVASKQTDHSVRRLEGRRLQGPGVRDNSSGLAGMLAALDLMARHGLAPEAGTYIVASVREEVGLKGAQAFVEDHGQELGAFIALDGSLGQVSYGATGIVWLKLHFKSGGAHTLKAHEMPSPILAAARAIERISAVPLRRSPEEMESWLNIGMQGGGDVPNAQARDAWFTVDLRSNDPAGLEDLEKRVAEIGSRTASEVGVQFERETLHRLEGVKPLGSPESVLVRSARDVLAYLGWEQVKLTPRGTADHDMALARRIPGIAIGVTTGDGAHTPDEYADTDPFVTGVKQVVLLLLTHLTTAER